METKAYILLGSWILLGIVLFLIHLRKYRRFQQEQKKRQALRVVAKKNGGQDMGEDIARAAKSWFLAPGIVAESFVTSMKAPMEPSIGLFFICILLAPIILFIRILWFLSKKLS